MSHTRGELQIIRSKKERYEGQIFIKVKNSHNNFVCKFYSCPNGKEAMDNVKHFLKSWYSHDDLLAACKAYNEVFDDEDLLKKLDCLMGEKYMVWLGGILNIGSQTIAKAEK